MNSKLTKLNILLRICEASRDASEKIAKCIYITPLPHHNLLFLSLLVKAFIKDKFREKNKVKKLKNK